MHAHEVKEVIFYNYITILHHYKTIIIVKLKRKYFLFNLIDYEFEFYVAYLCLFYN